MSNPVDDLGNVQVDFVWGNMPMQPDDARGMATLDPELDNHVIATTMYNGFPGYTPVPPFDDTIPNVAVPNLIGLSNDDAASDLFDAGLVYAATLATHVGATVANNDTVKLHTPTAGTVVNLGTTVDCLLFEAPTVPNLAGFTQSEAEAALIAVHLVLGTVTTSATGAGPENDGLVKSQSPASGGRADTGSAVDVVLYEYTAP